jgi:hypothetical protein
VEAETVEPAFVVPESGEDVSPCELLAVGCVGVAL